ncbi:DUF4190 domain-containing protein [Prescottella agglutinans]|uniref:DUF4190 domain-containing protein n=1 Tax=Prescottella agglutinans TaxID=1644129 RepID=A0ABT6M621_9NOCA|nr:DUF4190 domain-containing protein [Prescottella agglutinans]MDH6279365.1 hypothetical protein [Prescottella agglutinans]
MPIKSRPVNRSPAVEVAPPRRTTPPRKPAPAARPRPSDDFLDSLDEQTAKRTNVAAMVGLFSATTVVLFPAAIVFGLLGVYETSRRPDESGKHIAIAAVVVGLIELIAVVAITAYFANSVASVNEVRTIYR